MDWIKTLIKLGSNGFLRLNEKTFLPKTANISKNLLNSCRKTTIKIMTKKVTIKLNILLVKLKPKKFAAEYKKIMVKKPPKTKEELVCFTSNKAM